jgi:hypothetical protein
MLLRVPSGISLLGVNDRDPDRLDRMLEMLVAAFMSNLDPALLLEFADDLPAAHPCTPIAARP